MKRDLAITLRALELESPALGRANRRLVEDHGQPPIAPRRRWLAKARAEFAVDGREPNRYPNARCLAVVNGAQCELPADHAGGHRAEFAADRRHPPAPPPPVV